MDTGRWRMLAKKRLVFKIPHSPAPLESLSQINELDYDRFYKTLPDATAFAKVREMLQSPDSHAIGTDAHDIARAIENPGPEKHLNVVLISVESLSAEFSGTYGRVPSLTPQLDAIAKDSLVFDDLYASFGRS